VGRKAADELVDLPLTVERAGDVERRELVSVSANPSGTDARLVEPTAGGATARVRRPSARAARTESSGNTRPASVLASAWSVRRSSPLAT